MKMFDKRPILSEKIGNLFRQLISAVKYLHVVKSVVHGCIDISSILVNADLSLLQLTDFKMARVVNFRDPRHTVMHDQPGDPLFKSFEVVRTLATFNHIFNPIWPLLPS